MKAHLRTWKEPRELTATFRGGECRTRTHIPYQWVIVAWWQAPDGRDVGVPWVCGWYRLVDRAEEELGRLRAREARDQLRAKARGERLLRRMYTYVPVRGGLTAPQPAVNILQGNEPTT